MTSILTKLIQADERPSAFDYMRVTLALSIICFHSLSTSYGEAIDVRLWDSLWRAPLAVILPMFFSLSGFLVAGSLERSKTIITFLGLRVLRIVPALSVEVLLSAFILGPILTAYPLTAYFSDTKFFSYFLNILGDIHYKLPGVFLDNPRPETVNLQLWTVPWELACYVVLTAISILGIFKRRQWLLTVMVGYYLLQVANTIFHPSGMINGPVAGQTMTAAFVAGIFFYRFREKMPWSGKFFIAAALASMILLSVPNGDRFVALPIAYVTVWLGVLNPPRQNILLSGDYSYGLYLYGFPLQQAVASLGEPFQHWYINLLIVIPCASIIAAFSWWCVEKPTLRLRSYLKEWEAGYLSLIARFGGRLRRTT